MRIRSPSLPELHAFAAAARHDSFSRAAQELCVTQGAISRAIARLQQHLGIPLFTRQGWRSVLTEAGRNYLEAVAPAVRTIEAATVLVQAQRGSAHLRLSVTPTLFSHWLIPRLPDFRQRHPDITLSFVPYQRDDALDACDIDAWLRGGDGRWPQHIAADYVVGRELVPICRPAELQGPQAIREPQDLLTRPLLFHTHYPDNWAFWFKALGCPHPPLRAAADFERVALLVQAVIAGLGVAVVQRCLVQDDLAAGRIAIALQAPVLSTRGYHLCWAASKSDFRALTSFRQWLLDQGRGTPATA
ncbi:MAG: LysR substrate-binding domain-containing protein [Burkholderiaceae bacterium]